MKKLLILFAALAIVAGIGGVSIAGIQNSAHDFTNTTWGDSQICLPCHTPHNGETGVQAPLWNHELSLGPYNMYQSPTMDATVPTDPTGSSILCLSCHDGTVALDAFGGNLNGDTFMDDVNGSANLTTDLSNDHPISIVYDDVLAGADMGLFDPSKVVTIGSGTFTRTDSITEVMLENSVLQCSACHSVHNDYVAGGDLLKISNDGSALCLTCHNK